jgi:hypothetical protein
MGNGAAILMNTEMERLITINDHNGGSSASQTNKAYYRNSHTIPKPTIQRQNGLCAKQLPILADILMNSENVDSLPIAKLVDLDVDIARVTQRTVRDLKGQVDNEKLRRIWIALVQSDKKRESRFEEVIRGDRRSSNYNQVYQHQYIFYFYLFFF